MASLSTDRVLASRAFRRIGGAAAASLLVGSALFAVGAVALMRGDASALIQCQPHSNTPDELELLSMVNAWRLQYVPNSDPSHPLVLSAPLNAAAAGYAQYLADNPAASGHSADGQTVGERAAQCGYPASMAFGDDTVAVVHNKDGASLTTQQALDQMALESYYEAHMRVPVQLGLPSALPLRCVGIAKAVSADGQGVAYVAMFMGADDVCPQTVSADTPTPTQAFPGFSTRTPTPTQTTAKKATVHATPTPDFTHAHIAQIAVEAPDGPAQD